MKGCIITIKGSQTRKPSKWIVEEAVNANANDVADAISFASVTGSIGSNCSEFPNKTVKVARLCNTCGKKAGVYGEGHEECFRIENGLN